MPFGKASEDQYPHVTLKPTIEGYRPVLWLWHPNGYPQISATRDEAEFSEAQRSAMIWARELRVPYRSMAGEL